MAKKTFAVIGLGRFGESVVNELLEQDHDILVLDKDPDRVQRISKKVTHAATIDSTDKQSLSEVGIKSINHVIVAIGDDIQSSIMTSLILLELGVAKLTVKVQNDYHEKVLQKIGVTDTVFPEKVTGRNMASRLATGPKVVDYYDLGDQHSFFAVPMCAEEMSGQEVSHINATTLKQKIRTEMQANVDLIAIQQDNSVYLPGEDVNINIEAVLWLFGSNEEMKAFIKTWCATEKNEK